MKIYIYIFVIIITIISIYYYTYNKYNLKENGYIIIKNILNQEVCDRIMMTVNMEMIEKTREEVFILSSKNRKHLALPIDENIKYAIGIVCKKIDHIIDKNFKDPVIAECGIFLSYPGCNNQNWHRDSEKKDGNGNLFTFSVALDDINEVNGPLQLYNKSHKLPEDKYEMLNLKKEDLFNNKHFKKVSATCQRGDLIAWNSNIIHRGSKNNGNNIRPLFYFSILDNSKIRPKGPTYTLKSKYKGKVNLKEIIV